MKEIPVYIFTGFLEAGKTKFIQETFEDPRFNSGEKTLLLICEQGIEELCTEKFYSDNVIVEYVEDEEDLTEKMLSALYKKHKFERIVVEYNGMWGLDKLYMALPEGFSVYQEMMFASCPTFLTYNANMRNLVYDKLKSCEMIIFNRADDKTDKEEFHKIVRAANKNAQIAYEYTDGRVEYDEIEDPLPFDIDGPVVDIKDTDYAIWYRDMAEEPEKYLHGNSLNEFLLFIIEKQEEALLELNNDVHKFTLKFDYRNKDMPWGTAETAPKRCVYAIGGQMYQDDEE